MTKSFDFLLVIVAALALVDLGAGQYSCSSSELTVAAIENCVNAVRADPGAYSYAFSCNPWVSSVGPLYSDGALTTAAAWHANDMATQNFFEHTGSDFSTFDSRIYSAGFTGGSVGENLAFGYNSALEVVASWMCSPGHRVNLMNCDFDRVGTAVQCNSETCYVSQSYGCSGYSCCSGGGGGGAPAGGGGGGGSVLGAFFDGLSGGGGGGNKRKRNCIIFCGGLFG